MKNNKKPSQKDQKILEAVINQSQIATKVSIVVPEKLSQNESSLNKPLITQYLLNKILNRKVKKGLKFVAIYLGREENFQVADVWGCEDVKQNVQGQKQMVYYVKESTKVELEFSKKKNVSKTNESKSQQKSLNMEFLSSEYQSIKLAIISSLMNRDQYIKNGLGPLKGILISGFSGTGKTTFARQLVKSLTQQQSFIKQPLYTRQISSINLLSKVIGGAEQYIRTTFTQLKQNQPAILVIEDLHLLFSEKQISSNRTAMAGLISEMQSIEDQKLIVIGTVNSDYDLVNELRGSGRFQKEITLNLPNHYDRLKILQGFVAGLEQETVIEVEHLKNINLRMNGFSIGQIKQIIRQAYTTNSNKISRQAIEKVLKNYKPSQIKQLIVQVPEVYWNDIGGYQNVKSQIKKVAELPLKHPQVFKKFGIEPIKGIMLYGPPGCSKTMMAKAIATETKLNFIGVKGPQLFSKYVGDSQKAVRNIFKRARACSPCIIFFDEIDAIAANRSSNAQVSDRVLCQLLNEMDGIQGLKQVIIIAATNKPQILDPALTRPGRFDYMIYISPPDLQARKQIFKIYLSKSKHQNIQELSVMLASKTDGYTGAEISLVCRQSALIALQQNIECQSVEYKHYQLALKKIKRRLSIETVARYRNFQENLKY